MAAAVSLKNQILKHCGKIHSGIDEEPKLKELQFRIGGHGT
jgi:hypothetical protein